MSDPVVARNPTTGDVVRRQSDGSWQSIGVMEESEYHQLRDSLSGEAVQSRRPPRYNPGQVDARPNETGGEDMFMYTGEDWIPVLDEENSPEVYSRFRNEEARQAAEERFGDNPLGSFARGAFQYSLGDFGDEAMGAINYLNRGEDDQRELSQFLDDSNQDFAAAYRQSPSSYFWGGVGGAFNPVGVGASSFRIGSAGARFIGSRAPAWMTRILQGLAGGAAAGTVESAGFGMGGEDSPTMDERTDAMSVGGPVGAGFGLVGSLATRGAMDAGTFTSRRTGGSEAGNRGEQEIAAAMRESGIPNREPMTPAGSFNTGRDSTGTPMSRAAENYNSNRSPRSSLANPTHQIPAPFSERTATVLSDEYMGPATVLRAALDAGPEGRPVVRQARRAAMNSPDAGDAIAAEATRAEATIGQSTQTRARNMTGGEVEDGIRYGADEFVEDTRAINSPEVNRAYTSAYRDNVPSDVLNPLSSFDESVRTAILRDAITNANFLPGGAQGVARARREIQQIIEGEIPAEVSVRTVDTIMRAVGRRTGGQYGERVFGASQVYGELRTNATTASHRFAHARELNRGSMEHQEAVRVGASIINPTGGGVGGTRWRREVAGMTPGELRAAQVGAYDAIAGQLERGAFRFATSLNSNPSLQARLIALFGEEPAQAFMRGVRSDARYVGEVRRIANSAMTVPTEYDPSARTMRTIARRAGFAAMHLLADIVDQGTRLMQDDYDEIMRVVLSPHTPELERRLVNDALQGYIRRQSQLAPRLAGTVPSASASSVAPIQGYLQSGSGTDTDTGERDSFRVYGWQ